MACGRRDTMRQLEFWLPADQVAKPPGHVYYDTLNRLLAEHDFDRRVEALCSPYYAERGRPSIPPGVYFRMLLIGYFEGLDSQRGIAWRCADSLSLRKFLGIALTEETPDHSSMTVIRQRLPKPVFDAVFALVQEIAKSHKLLGAKTVGVDSTTLEANAAMKSIVRRDTGDDWREYVRKLYIEANPDDDKPTDEDLRRFDKTRKDKKVSNKDWVSSTDPSARIAKMKDGRTHLAYKAEHAVDLDSEIIVAAEIYPADRADGETIVETMRAVAENLASVDQAAPEEVAGDKGYHKAETLVVLQSRGFRTYIPEADRPTGRRWDDKPAEQEEAYRANRRRVKGEYGKELQRLRSERVERSFAHVCDTGGGRRAWLCGLEDVWKSHVIRVAAHNLGIVMRKAFGMGKPRSAWGENAPSHLVRIAMHRLQSLHNSFLRPTIAFFALFTPKPTSSLLFARTTKTSPFSTGC
jgi:transposase